MKNIIETFFEVGCAAILIVLAQTTILNDIAWFSKIFTVEELASVKNICGYFAAAYSILVLGVHMCKLRMDNEQYKKQMAILFDSQKTNFQSIIRQKVKHYPDNMQIRIFAKQSCKEKFLNVLARKQKINETMFKIRNHQSLSRHDRTENLMFRVSPNPQGLVGRSFNSKSVEYSWDLKENIGVDNYNMNNVQQDKTNDLRFCLCVPIKDDVNKEVKAIVAFDSTDKMEIGSKSTEDDILSLFVGYSIDLHESSPNLFK